ncbi:glycoside hydrolase family 130 protein [Acetivibrio saccincola]|uniref:Beta-1,4-mannooligosaccharide phosphorylase n=1 Tax=Acetivibrio saccincola TaxID=1677857 RepID=A0A2K9DZ52_9FIRM|nr:glycoside hydrolase family 130 protein [Acetivibrio saccincola]AUG56797.1 Beta-1,4-mannooligosaccharide phosphorylase [Acetivibrio saccincola]NLW28047.1 glycosidase [Acetivibrio saccincola]HOA96836.1 glycoside hydrolase family 130 protein [Acetivibrio saccincola]HQD28740.1 glycoside hydrolase family 130 protein [Acetivibrio saccincola]
MAVNVNRMQPKFFLDKSRVIAKLYRPREDERVKNVLNRIMSFSESEVQSILDKVIENFSHRHKNIWRIFDRNFNAIKHLIPEGVHLSDSRRALIGASFTNEYSIQAAAFFNPSIVPHFNQHGLPDGSLRFILSFRSTGENHISSIEFRSGVIDENLSIKLDEVSRFAETPKVLKNPTYDKHTFLMKLKEMNCMDYHVNEVFSYLGDSFTLSELLASINLIQKREVSLTSAFEKTISDIKWLAESNYEIQFSFDQKLSERVIVPVSSNESNGIEDARFVKFVDDNGSVTYYATYTAYNGKSILPQLLETKDFLSFKMITLNGKSVKDKGMALFPRKVNGKYMMISRIDGEQLFIMESDNIHFWNEHKLLKKPEFPWEIMQIGNCGSPIETDEGWILLTHGVGPMRQYCIGAILLDLEDPSKVIGVLEEPLLTPTEEEREGYVPNVVYSCGALLHNDHLIIPYAMSDTNSGFASVPVKELFDNFKMLK